MWKSARCVLEVLDEPLCPHFTISYNEETFAEKRDQAMVAADQWQWIEEILAACWELEPDRREQFLEGQCLPDTELLEEVLRLYHADLSADRWQPPETTHERDKRFGKYELENQIGRGGMGAVYLAHRADGEFQQRVAIKIIGMPFEPEEMRELFRRERQILAALNHPNITRLLDGGVTDQGQLYFVMEYVDGVPIHKFPASSEAKLDLFDGVCAAVQYAHQNLVIHRDIKPSNILVSREGVPKLLDFGAAKLLADSDATQTGFGLATLAYASPEQLRGEPASTLSDIFSLGAVLYELMTGRKPFGDDLTARIASFGTNQIELPRRLPGDLDTVVRKALATVPSERYQSVEQLAEDVRRYRAGEAVLAHPPSLGYRARRFLRRRWLSVSVAAISVIALATTATVALQQADAARREAASAQSEVARQKKLTNFLEEMLAAGSRGEGDIPISKMLDDVEPLLAQTFKDDPITEASLRMNLGASYTTLHKPERAKYEMEKALAAFRAAGDAKGQVVVLWLLGQTVITQSRLRENLRYNQEALELVTAAQTKAKPTWVFRVKRELAKAMLLISDERSRQVLERQRRLLEEAIAVATSNHSSSLSASDLYDAREHLARVFALEGLSEQAEEEMVRARSVANLMPKRPTDDEVAQMLAVQRRDFSAAARFIQASRFTLAVDDWLKELRWARYRAESGQIAEALAQVHAQAPLLPRYAAEGLQSEPLSCIAHVMLCAKQYREAERDARQLLAVLDANHREAIDPDRADAEELLACALAGEKHYAEAATLFDQAEQAYLGSGPGFKIAAGHVADLRRALPPTK